MSDCLKPGQEDSESAEKVPLLFFLFCPLLLFVSWLPVWDEERAENMPKGTTILILVNGLIFLSMWLNMAICGASEVFKAFGLTPNVILSGGQTHTFISSMFLHGDMIHLLLNMLFLWTFGGSVESRIGMLEFLGVYFLTGILGGLGYVFMFPASAVPCVGASGAVSGIMGAYLVLFPIRKIKVLVFNKFLMIPAFVYLGFWILMQISMFLLQNALHIMYQVSFITHIVSALTGVILAVILKKYKLDNCNSGDTLNSSINSG